MKANLSIKEAKFVKAYLQTGNISQSAKLAGAKGKDTFSLYTTGKRWLENVGITLRDCQEALGITDQYLTDCLQDGLKAKKRYYGTFQGKLIQSDEFEDFTNRAKYVEIAHKLRGQFIDRQEITGKDAGELVLQVMTRPGKKKDKGSVDL